MHVTNVSGLFRRYMFRSKNFVKFCDEDQFACESITCGALKFQIEPACPQIDIILFDTYDIRSLYKCILP